MVDRSPDDSGTTVACGMAIGIATVCVALRFYVRIHIKSGIAWDDWWILGGLLLSILTGGLLLWDASVNPDVGGYFSEAVGNEPATSSDASDATTHLKLVWVCGLLYFAFISAIKISVLLLYRRIFYIDESFRLQSLAVGIGVAAFWLSATIAILFNCQPLKYSFISHSREKHCFNYNIFWVVTGSIEVVMDTIILALPIRMVLALKLSRGRKVSVLLIFLLGGFVIVTGLLRVIYGYSPGSWLPSNHKVELWSAWHACMGISCACLPIFRPLFTSLLALVTTTSSTMRHRYHDLREKQQRNGKESDLSSGSSTRDTLIFAPSLRREFPNDVSSSDLHTRTARARDESEVPPQSHLTDVRHTSFLDVPCLTEENGTTFADRPWLMGQPGMQTTDTASFNRV